MELTAERLGTALAPPPAVRGAALSACAIVGLAAADGGFFPSSWRFGGLAFAAVACLLALWLPRRLGTAAVALLACAAGLAVLSLASALWSVDPGAAIRDTQRTLLYVAALASFVLAGEGLVAGVAIGAGAVGGWALAERAVAGTTVDPYEGRLLTGPIGYANGLGALMAVGLVVCVVLAVRERRLTLAAPLAVLVPALVLTGSRASLAAAAVGGAVGVSLLYRRRVLACALTATGAALLTALLIVTPAAVGDRAAYWNGARSTIAAHPLGGSGAGTFGLVHKQAPSALDAHSLYLQAFSELGFGGLLLVVVLLGAPLVLALRRGLAAPAAGLAAFALHAGVDWDWQLPAVTVAGLALAAAAVTAPAAVRTLHEMELACHATMGSTDRRFRTLVRRTRRRLLTARLDSAFAGHGDLERLADLTHSLIAEPAQTLDERPERDALD